MEKSTDMRVLAFSPVNLLDILSYCFGHAQPRYYPPRGDSRCQEESRAWTGYPYSCRDTQTTAYPDLRVHLPTSSFPEPAAVVPAFQALSADPCPRTARDQAALQGSPGLPVVPDHLVLRQLPHWMVTPESDFPTS